MNLLQMECGVVPTKVLKADKAEYIQSLIDTREKDDVGVFVNFMAAIHCDHLAQDIASFTASMDEGAAGQGGQKRWTEKMDSARAMPSFP